MCLVPSWHPCLIISNISSRENCNCVIFWVKITTRFGLGCWGFVTWLEGSGLNINDQKTEICFFHRKGQITTSININNTPIQTIVNIQPKGNTSHIFCLMTYKRNSHFLYSSNNVLF